ncbi:hypothetical protein J2Z42_000969 [Clostridium algifaecis]|uniref:Uncharacterized protein n=1 Tax=Clostridium algifaecis TaxID=1472040 RepID=A0ABS4KTZ3_9CLOT|nr:hypothetical protein [Clostridium algifaecis]MBP2032304.1 hypothetical protein [Clostridium algifaecis]
MKDNVIKVDFLKNKKRKLKKTNLLILIKNFFKTVFSSTNDTYSKQTNNEPDKKIINYSKYIS